MTEDDALLARVVATLREPVPIDPDLDRRVMAEIEGSAPLTVAAQGGPARLAWLSRSRTVRLNPLGGLAAAAALMALVFAAIRFSAPAGTPPTQAAYETSTSQELTQFVLVAPEAASVAVVGDFNDWSFSATPLARQAGDGVWWVTLPLRPGRYRYAFVVNGTNWQTDPSAPGAEDEFGRPNSVVTIGGA